MTIHLHCYPRGMVEIKNCKIKIFANPVVLTEEVRQMVFAEFDIQNSLDKVKVIADNSSHYQFKVDS